MEITINEEEAKLIIPLVTSRKKRLLEYMVELEELLDKEKLISKIFAGTEEDFQHTKTLIKKADTEISLCKNLEERLRERIH